MGLVLQYTQRSTIILLAYIDVTVRNPVFMSIVFIAAQAPLPWQEPVLHGLLVISAILSLAWLIKSLVKGGPLHGAVLIADRPGLMALALLITSTALLGLALSWLLEGLLGSQALEANLAGSLATLLSCSLLLALLSWKRPRQLRSLGLGLSHAPKQLSWGLITVLAVWPISVMVLMPLSFRLVKFVVEWSTGLSYTLQSHTLLRELGDSAGPMNFWLIVTIAVVVAPITEEIIFRGILQGVLSRFHHWRWTAILISAAIFSLVHLSVRENVAAGEASIAQIENIPPLFLLGLVLGYSYEKSRSLYRPIWIHMGFNALSMALWLNAP